MPDINPGQLGEAINWKADRDLRNLDNKGTSFVVQTGMVIIWPGTTVPDGFLLCDGSAISRTTYADLFAVIGTTYGPGDSSSTFNLPNLDFLLKGIKGTGKTLGLTDGTTLAGLKTGGSSTEHQLSTMTGIYGSKVGTTPSGSYIAINKGVGVTSDSAKSGIVSEIDTNINYIIKY